MPERVTLRPVAEDDLLLRRTLTQDPQVTVEFERYGWYAPRLFQRSWAEHGLISADGGNLMVVCGDEVLGAGTGDGGHGVRGGETWRFRNGFWARPCSGSGWSAPAR